MACIDLETVQYSFETLILGDLFNLALNLSRNIKQFNLKLIESQ